MCGRLSWLSVIFNLRYAIQYRIVLYEKASNYETRLCCRLFCAWKWISASNVAAVVAKSWHTRWRFVYSRSSVMRKRAGGDGRSLRGRSCESGIVWNWRACHSKRHGEPPSHSVQSRLYCARTSAHLAPADANTKLTGGPALLEIFFLFQHAWYVVGFNFSVSI